MVVASFLAAASSREVSTDPTLLPRLPREKLPCCLSPRSSAAVASLRVAVVGSRRRGSIDSVLASSGLRNQRGVCGAPPLSDH